MKSILRRVVKGAALCVALTVLPFAAGFLAPPARPSAHRSAHTLPSPLHAFEGAAVAQGPEGSEPVDVYDEVLSNLSRHYAGGTIDKKKTTQLTYAALRGMLFTLNDPFTGFLDPSEWDQMQQSTRGEFEGIGAVLEQFGPDVRVVRPIPGSPAYRAHLKSGDIIFSVGTHSERTGKLVKTTSTLGRNINDVVTLIKGKRRTLVTVTIMRKGVSRPIPFTLTRDRIVPPIVQYWMEDEKAKIGHIVLNEFNEKSDAQFDEAVADLERRGMRALVFDLRYNPGGLLDVAVDIGSRFVDGGRPIVIIQEKGGQRKESRYRTGRPVAKRYPTIVLINKFSASASEIVSGAIQDYSAATLIGEHTFGKGLVQTLFELHSATEGGRIDKPAALRLTTAKYFTPNGRDISNKYDDEHRPILNTGGVKPDIAVEQPQTWLDRQDFENKKDDKQLQTALDMLRKRIQSASRR